MSSKELSFYRSYEEFRKSTYIDIETKKFQKFFVASNGKKYEDTKVIYSTCTIDEEWIKHIENGLPFLEKAIREERQFIRNDEEVLPIEKIKKITVDGIKDLAKHSNYITHEPDGNTDAVVIPDKMLMVQRESDYAIYENRVIYATLIYLKDFVSSRLNKIKEATNRYEANTYIKKNIDIGNRKINVDFTLNEIRNDDPLRARKNTSFELVNRIDDIMSNVMALLKTPLMMEVSHADLVSRPITKNNVLKMNINFRESLALFDYIAEYSGDGFTIQRFEKTFSPYNNEMSNSYSDVIMLSSFITYMYGNSIQEELKQEFIQDEERRKKEEEERILNKLKSLSFKTAKDNMTINEYLDEFETGYRILEKRVQELENTLTNKEEEHKKQIEEIKNECDTKIEIIYEVTNKEKEVLKNDCENRLKSQLDEFDNRMSELRESHREEVSNLSTRLTKEKEDILNEKNSKISELDKTILNKNQTIKELNEEKDVSSALIVSLKRELGKEIDISNYLGKDDFNQLEKDKKAFDKFFKEAWKMAKKNIRKNILISEKEIAKKEKAEKELLKANKKTLNENKEEVVEKTNENEIEEGKEE